MDLPNICLNCLILWRMYAIIICYVSQICSDMWRALIDAELDMQMSFRSTITW
jgi:hypothetical protein